MIESPDGHKICVSIQLDFTCTDNQDEYEDMIIGGNFIGHEGQEYQCVRRFAVSVETS